VHFANRAGGVRRVVEHAVRVDEIEARVFEGKSLRVGAEHVGFEPFEPEPLAGSRDGCVREVDAGRARAGADEAHEVRGQADADLEHVLVLCRLEAGDVRDERLDGVAPPLDLVEELAGADRGRRGLRATRLQLPEPANVLLQRLGHERHRTASRSRVTGPC
jgi:hypothetical protein